MSEEDYDASNEGSGEDTGESGIEPGAVDERGSSKEYIKYLTEQKDDLSKKIINEFPLTNSKELVFANLSDKRQRLAIMHDVNIALLYERAKYPRDIEIMDDYWKAKILVEARITRSQGEYRDRILASQNIVENRVKPQSNEDVRDRTKSSLRRLFSI